MTDYIIIGSTAIASTLVVFMFLKNSNKESLDKKPWLDEEIGEDYYAEAKRRIKRNAGKI